MSVPDQSVYTNDNIGCIINASPGSNKVNVITPQKHSIPSFLVYLTLQHRLNHVYCEFVLFSVLPQQFS